MSLATAYPFTRAGSGAVSMLGLIAAFTLNMGLLAVLLEGVIDRLASGGDGVLMHVLAASGIAVMSGAAFLLLVWMAEDLAQGSGGAPEEGCA